MNTREIIASFLTFGLIFCLIIWYLIRPYTLHTELQHTTLNGVDITYAIRGYTYGKPVVLLHGNGGSHHDLDIITRILADAGYRVYTPDSRGQGANAPLDEYHYEDMADDIYLFVNQVIKPYYTRNFNKPAVFGWSDGGIIALLSEVKYPGTWSAIITSGANINPDCGIWDLESEREHPTYDSPLYKMMLYEPDITPSELATIQCPCLIAAGEYDAIDIEHTRLIANSILNGEVLIIEGADHGSHITNSTEMGKAILNYLKKIHY